MSDDLKDITETASKSSETIGLPGSQPDDDQNKPPPPVETEDDAAPTESQRTGLCIRCRPKKYTVAAHKAVVDYRHVSIKSYDNLMQSEQIELSAGDEATEMIRRHSFDTVFNANSQPNVVLTSIKNYGESLKNIKDKREFQKLETLSSSTIAVICTQVKEMFSYEQRCLKINSPCYVFGNILGNIRDLISYGNQIWRLFPAGLATNLLFLGNYIGRDEFTSGFGIECVIYLFCLKIIRPGKVFLIRGNLDVKSALNDSKFLNECLHKYGENDGKQVFDQINSVFDCLPVCALIDENIFACHGGIPKSLTTIDELMKISNNLTDPENDCPAAWEIFCSDPIENFSDEQIQPNQVKDGFAPNKSGSGNFFSSEALHRFLKTNDLQFVIRSHQKPANGYNFNHRGKVITISSSSTIVSGGNQKSACAFLYGSGHDGLIRILRIDTA